MGLSSIYIVMLIMLWAMSPTDEVENLSPKHVPKNKE